MDSSENKSGCLLCGAEIQYLSAPIEAACGICHKVFMTNTICREHHYICDLCHTLSGVEVIKQYCLQASSLAPIVLAMEIMDLPQVKMHGPEHHFLVPAVLITAYYNKIGQPSSIPEKLRMAKQRAQQVKGGACGFLGNCGAAAGTGIFMSVVTDCNPLSTKAWQLSNSMTAHSLMAIAKQGGPRCCKRDTFLSLLEAIPFVKKYLGVSLSCEGKLVCRYSKFNKECQKESCPFFKED